MDLKFSFYKLLMLLIYVNQNKLIVECKTGSVSIHNSRELFLLMNFLIFFSLQHKIVLKSFKFSLWHSFIVFLSEERYKYAGSKNVKVWSTVRQNRFLIIGQILINSNADV